MGSISHHITPLVINSLRGGHTHILKFTDKAILRNQAHAGLWPAHAWFNYLDDFKNAILKKEKGSKVKKFYKQAKDQKV